MIELMIVVAVIALLASIAYPSYTDYVRRGRIAEATAALTVYRVEMEKWFQNNRNYGSTATTCGATLTTAPMFTISCGWGASADNQSYVAAATGTDAMTGFTFTIDDANLRRTTGFPGATVPANCWLRRAGDAC